MKFSELTDQNKIQYIKDGFVLILEQLAKEPEKLKSYIVVPTKPEPLTPILEMPSETITDDEKAVISARNKIAAEQTDAKNALLQEEYKAKTEHYNKVFDIIAKLEKREGCLCGSCINLNIVNSVIPPELEVLIDAARQEAETKSY